MKLCIHCVHYLDHPQSKDPQHGFCDLTPQTRSMVTGEVEKDHDFCSTYRIGKCGPEARFFEPILGLDAQETEPPVPPILRDHFGPRYAYERLTQDELRKIREMVTCAVEVKLKEKNSG